MDALVAKRNLAKERDNAQDAIDSQIQRMAASSRESEFAIPVMLIAGDINLSKLRPLNITSIVTKEGGSITGVTGIPDSVKNFKFEKHLLIEAPQLPANLETLNLNGNYIENIDLSNLKRLRVAHLNGNRLKSLNKQILPESLEELYIDNNRITLLDLDSLENLRILHCRNNRMMRIENIPASIVDLQVEEGNPNILLYYAFLPNNIAGDDNERMRGTEAELIESMADYFRLKSRYEKRGIYERHEIIYDAVMVKKLGIKKGKKMAREHRPKCVNCKRPVGTVFKTKDDCFIAYCGDTKDPCPLAIKIFKSRFESNDLFAKYNTNSLTETKEKIIRQKMDVLFNYSTEEETVKKFKDLIEDYNLYSYLNKTDNDIREEKRFNVHKRELIKGKLKLIEEIKGKMNAYMEEYEESDNRDALHSAMDIYIREYMPEINNLSYLKYGVMEMVVPGTETDTQVRALNQGVASLRHLETLHGEVPKVLKFRVGTNTEPEIYQEREPAYNEYPEQDEEEVPFESSREDDDGEAYYDEYGYKYDGRYEDE